MITMVPWLNENDPFPDVNTALTADDGYPGLLALGADLSPKRLLEAYRSGIFPWYCEEDPVLWWSTDPRMVLFTDEFKISASLKKKLRQVEKSLISGGIWQLSFDSDFESVIRACAEPRNGKGTWITEDMIEAYCTLHNMGFTHSVELRRNRELVGGAYGVSIGRMFFGESMFSRISDASKIALAALVYFLKSNDVLMIDCQQETEHLASLGARPISRNDFMAHIRQAVNYPQLENWFVEKIF